MWAKLILGRFRDAVRPIFFLDLLLVQTTPLLHFSLTPVMEDIGGGTRYICPRGLGFARVSFDGFRV